MSPELEAVTQQLEELEKQVAHLAALVTDYSDNEQTFSDSARTTSPDGPEARNRLPKLDKERTGTVNVTAGVS